MRSAHVKYFDLKTRGENDITRWFMDFEQDEKEVMQIATTETPSGVYVFVILRND